MLQRGKKGNDDVDLQKFSEFNAKLFAEPSAVPPQHVELQDWEAATIEPEELELVL